METNQLVDLIGALCGERFGLPEERHRLTAGQQEPEIAANCANSPQLPGTAASAN